MSQPTSPTTANGTEIENLFKSFNWDINDSSLIESVLNDELSALEAANVHALLHAGEQNPQVLKHIDSALFEVDNIDDMINTYSSHLNVRKVLIIEVVVDG